MRYERGVKYMALIKCSNCGKEISSNAKACVHCGKELAEHYASSINGTEKNINFFLKLAKVFKYVAYILAVVVLLIGIACQDGLAFAVCFISSMVILAVAFLSTQFFEWKAYMLKNIYEINQKEGR